MVDLAAIAGVEVIQPGLGTVRGGVPVVPAAHARTGQRALVCGLVPGDQDRTAGGSHAIGPVDLGVSAGEEELAAGAVQSVEVAVAVGMHQHLARLPVDFDIDQHRISDGVPVVHIVRSELEMPAELARVGV